MRNLEIKTQNGRSMIEMLGVLAIIGVLSVGGIAGYSKAMMKYRINKTIEQITLIAGNIRSFFASQGNYDGLNYNTDDGMKIIRKAKLVPDEMLVMQENGKYKIEANEKDLFLGAGEGFDSTEGKYFYIGFYAGSLSVEECIELITHDWNTATSGFIGLGLNSSDMETGHPCVPVTEGEELVWCANNPDTPMPVPLNVAVEVCQNAVSDNGVLEWKFK